MNGSKCRTCASFVAMQKMKTTGRFFHTTDVQNLIGVLDDKIFLSYFWLVKQGCSCF